MEKLIYYIKLGIKKPWLILSVILKRHIGVIICVPITDIVERNIFLKCLNIKLTYDIEHIYQFYQRMNRDSVSREQIIKWIKDDYDCFLVYNKNSEAIAGMWIFKNRFILSNMSGRTLDKDHEIFLDEDTIYGAYVVVHESYRGQKIGQNLLMYVINYYNKNSNYKKILMITGASNKAFIKSSIKFSGRLIGITEVFNLLGFKKRKELYLDSDEKIWNNKRL